MSVESSEKPASFPIVPAGWYLCHGGRQLGAMPHGFSLGGHRRVAFRTVSGRPVVLDARCSHMGADLSRGMVCGEAVRCPLHAWEYGVDGRCTRIPAGGDAPTFARQAAYPTDTLGNHVFFFNGPTPAYALPFFDGVHPRDLRAARPFDFVVDTPWYLIGANGFDLQHFNVAHDRTLAGTPAIEAIGPHARRITATFDVTGDSWRDAVTRRLAGPRVRMSVTSWSGTLVLVTATFRRTTSYGLVSVTPLDAGRSHVRVVVWVPRRGGAALSPLDRLDARIRRSFIRAFVADDAVRSNGIRYRPATLIHADRELDAYLRWLSALHSTSAVSGATA